MRVSRRKGLVGCVMVLLLLAIAIHHWSPGTSAVLNTQERLDPVIQKVIESNHRHLEDNYKNIPYRLNPNAPGVLAKNGCVCEGDSRQINVPFSDLLFPRVGAQDLRNTLQTLELEDIKKRRQKEYSHFQKRSRTAADLLIVAQANSPLQYPTQGVEVRPKMSIVIPGLALKDKPRSFYAVNLTAIMGKFDIAAFVENVQISGEGQMHMNLSSSDLSLLNKQLQIVMYTNTVFHPNTVDIVQFGTDGFLASFTIKIRHEIPPKLYDSGSKAEYNVSALVTIATKTFLRYDKLQDLIDSIRQFYPTVTIIIADDNEHPKPINGPYIEHYIMPFGKGWFAGRNLAVSQVTTKYVLWADDDFIFTSNTKLEKMVEVLESTTLDLVGGAVREVTGYTATYRHTISTEAGGQEGDCLHTRMGYHHVLEGFPNCVVTDAVINFFMARTEKVQQVGFDPQLARIAHLEFFVDGLGKLHIGSCDDVIINHASKIKGMLPWGQSETDKAYSKFRFTSTASKQYNLFYFKNHFKCITSNG